jgi:uncharacterized protein YqeY
MAEQVFSYGWDPDSKISLYNKIRQDLKQAMIKKDTRVRDALRLIMGAFPDLTVPMTLESGKKTTRVKQPDEITDEDILGIIRKFVKAEQTVLEHKKEATSDYIELLKAYLPGMASEDEIREWIQKNIDLAAYKSPLQATGTVMKHFGKLADGKMVQTVLKTMSA